MIYAPNPAESLSKLVEAIRLSGDLPDPKPIALEELPVDTGKIGTSSIRGWMMRPSAHIGETIEGVFKVGTVDFCDVTRANEASLDPNDCVYVRLYVEPSAAGPGLTYINAIAPGKEAVFFEQEDIVGKTIKAKIKLKTVHQTTASGEPCLVPVIVIELVRFSGTS